MIDDDLIERLWSERKEDPKMTTEEIARALRPRAGRGSRVLKFYLWLYLAVLSATLVLQGMNLEGYRTNATMLAVHAAVVLLTLGFVGFGIHLVGEVGRLERMDESLADAIRRRLSFLRGKYEAWLWASAAAVLLLIWALTTFVDNVGGSYPINKPFVFFGTNVAIFLFTYAVNKVAHVPVVREFRAVLEDLEAQVLDRTHAVDLARTRWRRWGILLTVILAVLFLFGVWRALGGLG